MAGGIFIERELYQSKAFNHLTGFSPQLLFHFLDKRYFKRIKQGKKKKYVCTNPDNIRLSYAELKRRFGITQPRVTRGIDQLLAHGFIAMVKQGGTGEGDYNVYSMSDNWCIWNVGQVMSARDVESVARGFCKPKKRL